MNSLTNSNNDAQVSQLFGLLVMKRDPGTVDAIVNYGGYLFSLVLLYSSDRLYSTKYCFPKTILKFVIGSLFTANSPFFGFPVQF